MRVLCTGITRYTVLVDEGSAKIRSTVGPLSSMQTLMRLMRSDRPFLVGRGEVKFNLRASCMMSGHISFDSPDRPYRA